MTINKFFKSESLEVQRSEIHLADYNPRTISDEARKSIKRGIKKYGLLGGLIVNKRTGMRLVSGHQRLSVMDELNKFPDNDYTIRVDVIDVDQTQEKELNILLNNPNAQGQWDFDALRKLIPDIDYKDAGLTEEDLNLIGVDFMLQNEEENNLADSLDELMLPVQEKKEAEKEEKKEHMKQVKEEVKKAAQEKAKDLDAYVMLSFDTFEAKSAFMQRFGYDQYEKFLKGEVFSEQVERVE
mgnify:FL=1